MKIEPDSAQVRVPPPLMLLICIGLGLVLHFIAPLPILTMPSWWLRVFGGAVVLGAVATIFYCAALFKRHRTHVEPWKATTQLIGQGLYRRTRNPIYLSFVFIVFGTALSINSLWMALMMLPLMIALDRLVIAKEERYLTSKFGDAYLAYKRQVRRWL
ncbi:MAG: isoprenylcysteine carboxylmethyltransferase family protein [Myxococcales bacterium]|nr:isoprenylcysteine carboxylmethyltransferase family protein [Myxococcales bacterium]